MCGIYHTQIQPTEHDIIAIQGRVIQKVVNANPRLKVNWSINFSSIKKFFTSYVLCTLRLFKLKTEEQTMYTENLTEKL